MMDITEFVFTLAVLLLNAGLCFSFRTASHGG